MCLRLEGGFERILAAGDAFASAARALRRTSLIDATDAMLVVERALEHANGFGDLLAAQRLDGIATPAERRVLRRVRAAHARLTEALDGLTPPSQRGDLKEMWAWISPRFLELARLAHVERSLRARGWVARVFLACIAVGSTAALWWALDLQDSLRLQRAAPLVSCFLALGAIGVVGQAALWPCAACCRPWPMRGVAWLAAVGVCPGCGASVRSTKQRAEQVRERALELL